MSWKDILKLDMEEEFEETKDPYAYDIDPRIEAHRRIGREFSDKTPLKDYKTKRSAVKINPEIAEPYSSYGSPRAYGRLNSVETRKLKRKRRLKEPVYIDNITDEKYPEDYRQKVRD